MHGQREEKLVFHHPVQRQGVPVDQKRLDVPGQLLRFPIRMNHPQVHHHLQAQMQRLQSALAGQPCPGPEPAIDADPLSVVQPEIQAHPHHATGAIDGLVETDAGR